MATHKVHPPFTRPSARAPFTFARHTAAHEEHPERNEDTLLTDPVRGLAAVFDGVGYGPGQVASRMAARLIRRGWQQALARVQQKPTLFVSCAAFDLRETLRQIIADANQQIHAEGERRVKAAWAEEEKEEGKLRPETTGALVILSRHSDDGYMITHAHVGDSRVYLLRGQEKIQRLTNDDGYFSLLLKKDIINLDDALRIDQASIAAELTETERSYFSRRNGITQSLGDAEPVIHIDQSNILPGDRILLCTDGIHDNLIDQELEVTLRSSPRTTVARRLVQQAIERSHQDSETTIRAKKDDMSAIVITCNFS